MKNKNVVSIVLYVFSVLCLGYTCYAGFQAYTTFTSYYSAVSYDVVTLIMYIISTVFQSLCFAVVFYGMATMSDMLFKLLPKKEEVKKEEAKKEEAKKEEVKKEEPKQEEVTKESSKLEEKQEEVKAEEEK